MLYQLPLALYRRCLLVPFAVAAFYAADDLQPYALAVASLAALLVADFLIECKVNNKTAEETKQEKERLIAEIETIQESCRSEMRLISEDLHVTGQLAASARTEVLTRCVAEMNKYSAAMSHRQAASVTDRHTIAAQHSTIVEYQKMVTDNRRQMAEDKLKIARLRVIDRQHQDDLMTGIALRKELDDKIATQKIEILKLESNCTTYIDEIVTLRDVNASLTVAALYDGIHLQNWDPKGGRPFLYFVASITSMSAEDAAALLQDFVSSIENLPGEVAFLLGEISHKETQLGDILAKVGKRDNSIQKHHKANGLLSQNANEPSQLMKCRVDFNKSLQVADEKVLLAERGVRLLTKHMNRLNTELNKLQGVQPFSVSANFGAAVDPALSAFPQTNSPLPIANPDGSRKRKNLPSIDTSAATANRGLSPTPLGFAVPGMPTSAHAAPSTARSHRPSRLSSTFAADEGRSRSPASASNKKQRLTASATSLRPRGSVIDDLDGEGEDEDAEGEEMASSEMSEAQNDDQLYCICQKVSYGEMVGCDNPACRVEWFHLSCVHLKEPPEGEWLCPLCEEGRKETRKGR